MRVAALYAALFVFAVAGFTAVVLWIVADNQRSALEQANAQVLSGYRDEGMDEAKEVLRQVLGDPRRGSASGLYMILQGPADAELLG